jgi:8-oxo-dGTP pyrophosphatase MutT (NUDIX family)
MENTKEDRKKTCLLNRASVSIFDTTLDQKKKNYKNIRCCNCNELGHIVKHCNRPITSYGIILYRYNTNKEIEYLLICRKHSIGYIEFIRGNYNISDTNYLIKIFKTMTKKEIQDITNLPFRDLWTNLWNNKYKYNKEYLHSKNKFYNLKNNKYSLNVHTLIKKTYQYDQPEWGFPKGRKNIDEHNIDTAKREFFEETNISKEHYTILKKNDTYITFEEKYDAFNNKTYKLIYYIAHLHNDTINIVSNFNKYQKNEISQLDFFSLDDAINIIRPYYNEKKKIIKKINTFIKMYK